MTDFLKKPSMANLDAFLRLRVSQVTTQMELKQLHDNLPLFIDQVQLGAATSTFDITEKSTRLECTNVDGDVAIAQTKQRGNYQSGKSPQGFMTFKAFGNTEDVVVKSYNKGTQTSSLSYSQWLAELNADANVPHDFNKNTILTFDFEWLGLGGYLFSLIKNRTKIDFAFTDFTDEEGIYMNSPNQPLRWEVRRTGVNEYTKRIGYFSSSTVSPYSADLDGIFLEVVSSTPYFDFICSTFGTEGALNEVGKVLGDDLDGVEIDAAVAGTNYAVMGIRLKANRVDTEIDILDMMPIERAGVDCIWRILLNPTISDDDLSATWDSKYIDINNSSVQIAKAKANGSHTVTALGTILASGQLKSSGGAVSGGVTDAEIVNAIRLGSNIDGSVDDIVLMIQPYGANADVSASINWRERT